MANTKKAKSGKQNMDLSSEAVIKYLSNRGIIGDEKVDDERLREIKRQKAQNTYHNTLLLLKNYKTIAWMLECFPDDIANELEQPFTDLDKLIDHMDTEIAWGNKKLENRLAGIQKSRILIDRVNEALTVLKRKPEDGQKLYDLIYLTFIAPESLNHTELLYRLNMSSRHYYRCRDQAINIISLRLWSAPAGEVDMWLEIISVIEQIQLQSD